MAYVSRTKAQRVSDQEQRYVSYLLRLWQVQSKDGLVWRASLEHASTGERRGFAYLADLYAFLEQKTAPVDEDLPGSDAADCSDGRLDFD
jgi:hypothetical protein